VEGIVYLVDSDSYACWDFYTPDRASQDRQVKGSEVTQSSSTITSFFLFTFLFFSTFVSPSLCFARPYITLFALLRHKAIHSLQTLLTLQCLLCQDAPNVLIIDAFIFIRSPEHPFVHPSVTFSTSSQECLQGSTPKLTQMFLMGSRLSVVTF